MMNIEDYQRVIQTQFERISDLEFEVQKWRNLSLVEYQVKYQQAVEKIDKILKELPRNIGGDLV